MLVSLSGWDTFNTIEAVESGVAGAVEASVPLMTVLVLPSLGVMLEQAVVASNMTADSAMARILVLVFFILSDTPFRFSP